MSDEAAAPEAEESAEATSETETETPPEKEETKEAAPEKEATTDYNFRDTFTDDKLRKQAERYDSAQAMLENINKLQGEVSRRVKLPGEEANDEDLAKYRKAIGVPETKEGYDFQPGEGREWTEEDKALLGAIGEIFHTNNVPAEGAIKAVAAYNALALEAVAAAEVEVKKAQDEAEVELRREWSGDEYDANTNLSKQFIEHNTDENLKAFLAEAKLASGVLVADDPAMTRHFARMARATEENELMLGVSGSDAKSLQEQINAHEEKHPPGTVDGRAHDKELTALYEKLHGAEPIVGSGLRTA